MMALGYGAIWLPYAAVVGKQRREARQREQEQQKARKKRPRQ
jgi:hypothetical protein